MLGSLIPEDRNKLKCYISTLKVAVFTIWVAGLAISLFSMIKDRHQNTWNSYVTAVGTFITFLCYCSLMIMDGKYNTISEEEQHQKDAQMENLTERVGKLEEVIKKQNYYQSMPGALTNADLGDQLEIKL